MWEKEGEIDLLIFLEDLNFGLLLHHPMVLTLKYILKTY